MLQQNCATVHSSTTHTGGWQHLNCAEFAFTHMSGACRGACHAAFMLHAVYLAQQQATFMGYGNSPDQCVMHDTDA
jgi:hypothetical protein